VANRESGGSILDGHDDIRTERRLRQAGLRPVQTKKDRHSVPELMLQPREVAVNPL
jgi:hypothetical protein